MFSDPNGLLLALRRAYRLSRREYREGLTALGLTARQAAALLAVQEHPGRGIRFLAGAIDADLPTCSVLVGRLEALGFVVRESDPADRRRTRLSLAARGADIAEAVRQAQDEADERLAAAIGTDAGALRALLNRLCERLAMDPAVMS